MRKQSLDRQTDKLEKILDSTRIDRYASGLFVSIRELDGKEVAINFLIQGEYCPKLLEEVGKLLLASIEYSIPNYELMLREAKSITEKAKTVFKVKEEEK